MFLEGRKTMRTLLVVLMFCGLALVSRGSAQETDMEHPKEITNSIGMKLVLIPNGTFTMGSPSGEVDRQEDETQHEVTISQDYYLGAFEVTQAQYERVTGKNPSYFQGEKVAERHPRNERESKDVDSSNHPVEQVTWVNAVDFCRRLSELPEEKKAGRVYRLPSEAEWEYACRAGSQTAYSSGDDETRLGEYAWFGNNSGDKEIDTRAVWNRLSNTPEKYRETLLSSGCKTHPVGGKKPNAWGLYDMHGNVGEWCSDRYYAYPEGAVTDPVGPQEVGRTRVYRGGNWINGAPGCRSSLRSNGYPTDNGGAPGFRVALSSLGIPQ
jgi:formylglycine-generating enzyme required for sulfatase activity